MPTDRYRDSMHKKNQTNIPILKVFSVRLKLANNPKIHPHYMTPVTEMSLPANTQQRQVNIVQENSIF